MTIDFPVTRPESCPFDPDATYARLREEAPVTKVHCPAGMDAWLVSGYDDIREVLANPRLSSRGAGSNHMLPSYDPDDQPEVVPGFMIQLDGPEHTRLRRLLMTEFTVRRMEALRSSVQKIADEHIDAMLTGTSADLVQDFALPIPTLVICSMLGVPYADRDQFDRDSQVLISFDMDEATRELAGKRMDGYLRGLVEERIAEPRDDVLSRLIARGNETDQPLTVEELVVLSRLMLVAGHESTANMITLSTLVLLDNPDQMAALRDDPGKAATAVEEMLRYLSVIQFGLLRYATEDVRVGGVDVKAGEWIVAAIPSGNRDAAAYPDPDVVDIDRQARTNLAFGFGPHMCIGYQLARIEMQVALTTLLRRVPTLRLARPLTQEDFKLNDIVYGVRTMPVTW